MLNKIARPTLVVLSVLVSCITGCMASTSDTNAAQAELRNGIDVVFIDYDAEREDFTLYIEIDNTVLADRNARYLLADLAYAEPNGAGVSPFSSSLVSDLDITRISRTRSSTELHVSGPRPSNIDDVIAVVSANPTPHP